MGKKIEYIIKFEDCVNYIINNCDNYLYKSLKILNDDQNRNNFFLELENHNIYIDYSNTKNEIEKQISKQINNSIINLGKLFVSKDLKPNLLAEMKVSLLQFLFGFFKFNIDKIQLKYKNILNIEKEKTIYTSEIDELRIFLEKQIKEVLSKKEHRLLRNIKDRCEYCEYNKKDSESCLSSININNLESIYILDNEDIDYLWNKRIDDIESLKRNIIDEDINKEILEDMSEKFKDKRFDVYKCLNKKDSIDYYDKYFLDWNKGITGKSYIINFEGYSKYDIVYSFSYKAIEENHKKIKSIILTDFNSKEKIEQHYTDIIEKMYELCEGNTIFYSLAPYNRLNFEKIINSMIDLMNYRKFKNDDEIIRKILFLCEYFDMKYSNGDLNIELKDDLDKDLNEKYINFLEDPFIDKWLDIKTIIEKYLCLNINVKYSLKKVFEKIEIEEYDEENINKSFDYSWALKPYIVNKIIKKDMREEDLKIILFYKLENIEKLRKKIFSILENNKRIIKPYKINLNIKEDINFQKRFIVRETVSNIKEYKQEVANYKLKRLCEKGIALKVLKLENKQDSNDEYEIEVEENTEFNYNDIVLNIIKEGELEDFIQKTRDSINQINFIQETRDSINRKKKEYIKIVKNKQGMQISKQSPQFNGNYYILKGLFSNSKSTKTNEKKLLENLNNIKVENIDEVLFKDIVQNKECEKDDILPPKHFNDSQKETFSNLIHKKLTILVGPPGTGKTYFIAESICEIFKNDKTKRILVTGFTNNSIDNCKRKIENIIQDKKCIKKISSKSSKEDIENISSEKGEIIASTVYQLYKGKGKIGKFDLIVVDEASQLKISEFLITLNFIKNNTKFLIVGDDNQLGPIIKNQYYDIKNKEILQSKSIFDYLKHKADEKEFAINKLTDCYRMVETLCCFPKEKIYTKLESKVKETGFYMHLDKIKNKNIQEILDPQYPNILCIVGNQHKGQTSENEAKLAADISWEYFEFIKKQEPVNKMKDMKVNSFWGQKLSIISPHHSQIRLIKKYLLKNKFENEEDKEVMVNTVEKMQGQESDVVIISYGVSDLNVALKEYKFLYSKNRFNVSITRARYKLVVILSEEILNINENDIEDEKAKEGISFIKEYVEFFKENSEKDYNKKELGSCKIDIYRSNINFLRPKANKMRDVSYS